MLLYQDVEPPLGNCEDAKKLLLKAVEINVFAHKTCAPIMYVKLTSALFIGRRALVRWQVNQDGARVVKRFPITETVHCDN